MDLIVMIGVIVLFGGVILSTIAQRNSSPPAPMIVVRADSFERASGGDSGFSLVILLAVIAAAVWFL